jgi:formate dehydrogenase subunit delta
MSPDPHSTEKTMQKLAYMANQIATFFTSKPHAEGVAGVAAHINDFWEPRMRRHLFEQIDAGGTGLHPLVMEAAATIRRPAEATH